VAALAHAPAAPPPARRSGDEDGGCAFTNMLDTLAFIAAAEMPSPRAGSGRAPQVAGGVNNVQQGEQGGEEEEEEEEEEKEEEEQQRQGEEEEGSIDDGEAGEEGMRCRGQGAAVTEPAEGQQQRQEAAHGAANGAGAGGTMEVDGRETEEQQQQQQQQKHKQEDQGQEQQQEAASATLAFGATPESAAAMCQGDCAAQVVRKATEARPAKCEATACGGAEESMGVPEAQRCSPAAAHAAPVPDAPRGAVAEQLIAHLQQAVAGA
jgi:hypothetical protein